MHAHFEICSESFSFTRPTGEPLEVISSFSLSVDRGGIHAIMAPSGAGKTTYLLGMSGTQSAKVCVYPPPSRIGFCFQNDRLIPWRTIGENVLLPHRRAAEPAALAARAEKLLERLSLGGVWTLFPRQLSGGMRKRVALARALLHAPDLLLLDEALTGLDISLVGEVSDVVRSEVRNLRAAAVLVSHDPVHVALLADTISFMRGPPLAPVEERTVACISRDVADKEFGIEVSAIYDTLARVELFAR